MDEVGGVHEVERADQLEEDAAVPLGCLGHLQPGHALQDVLHQTLHDFLEQFRVGLVPQDYHVVLGRQGVGPAHHDPVQVLSRRLLRHRLRVVCHVEKRLRLAAGPYMFEAEAVDEDLEELRRTDLARLERAGLLLQVVQVLRVQLFPTQLHEPVELLLLHVRQLLELDVFHVHFGPSPLLASLRLLAVKGLV